MKIERNSHITYNKQYLMVDEKPWFPVMGEIHYSRVPHENWKEELLKMKAGGVDLVSCYCIWIHHEEIKGEWDFTGDRDLHAFLQTVADLGMKLVLRVGPWIHGEVRNGGFPDWLMEKAKTGNFDLRSDAPEYMEEVRRYYTKLAEESKGFYHKDGGPIVGVQIENEYGHCGGFGGEVGETHMKNLLALAKEVGICAEFYTATGWGGAVTGGMIPVMGGYCEAPWDQRTTEIEPSGNYVFTKERNDHNIGSDHGLGVGITFDMDKFPYLTAELGGGLQVTGHRRPIATGTDIGAMSMVKLGSGCNLLGYYMYHGGTNPEGKLTTLQESKETGYPNDLPVKSYDFNAPVREYGQMNDNYREIKLLAMFVHDYEDQICRMSYVPQPGNPEKPEDLTSFRSAVRYTMVDGKASGFYFVNNYQRRYEMASHSMADLVAYDEKGQELAHFDSRDVVDGDFFFYPFHLDLGEGYLESCNATPLCKLNGPKKAAVFYIKDGIKPNYVLDRELQDTAIITLKKELALQAQKVTIAGQDHIIIANGDVVPDEKGGIRIYYHLNPGEKPQFKIWPDLPKAPQGFTKVKEAQMDKLRIDHVAFAAYEGEVVEAEGSVRYEVEPRTGSENNDVIKVRVDVEGLKEVNDSILVIDWAANQGKAYIDGKLVVDQFYTGQPWEIGLKRFFKDDKGWKDQIHIDLELTPLYENDNIYLQEWPKMENGVACRINAARLMIESVVKI